jgi:outer membrane translocation and assembly module TamA
MPFDWWIFHFGGVVFYDVGAAFDKWHEANATHAIGVGLRFLAPQISAVLFRVDVAFPIYGQGKEHHVVVPSFGTGQAF